MRLQGQKVIMLEFVASRFQLFRVQQENGTLLAYAIHVPPLDGSGNSDLFASGGERPDLLPYVGQSFGGGPSCKSVQRLGAL